MNVKEKDKKYFGRGSAVQDLEVLRAEGSYLYAANGDKYVDFLGGAGVGIFGWGHPEIEEAMKIENTPSYVYPNFYYRRWADLAELLAEITPDHLVRSFRATGGSEAVEAAMQMAMMYTKRKKFLSIEGAYHGNTIGALSIGASAKQENFPNLLPGCEKIEPPLNEETLDEIENLLKSNEFAAFIMEPVIVNMGVLVPEQQFMEKLDKICKEQGTLLIMDEAITGFGRTGKLFATEHYNIKPDIICMAKALSAGHAGIGAVITTNEIAKEVEGEIGLYSSYGWHPISVDVAMVTLNNLVAQKEEIFQNIEKIGKIFQEKLADIKFKKPVEINIKGLAIGIDVQDEGYASELKEACLKAGLTMNTEGSSLVFLPALNIKEDTVYEGINILKETVEN